MCIPLPDIPSTDLDYNRATRRGNKDVPKQNDKEYIEHKTKIQFSRIKKENKYNGQV